MIVTNSASLSNSLASPVEAEPDLLVFRSDAPSPQAKLQPPVAE